jgi:hypothetical protein
VVTRPAKLEGFRPFQLGWCSWHPCIGVLCDLSTHVEEIVRYPGQRTWIGEPGYPRHRSLGGESLGGLL